MPASARDPCVEGQPLLRWPSVVCVSRIAMLGQNGLGTAESAKDAEDTWMTRLASACSARSAANMFTPEIPGVGRGRLSLFHQVPGLDPELTPLQSEPVLHELGARRAPPRPKRLLLGQVLKLYL